MALSLLRLLFTRKSKATATLLHPPSHGLTPRNPRRVKRAPTLKTVNLPLAADSDENGVAALKKKFKEKHDAWKFKRGSGPATKEHKGKTWHWCTGPGHFGYHMWVAHEPGACTSTGDRGGRGRGTNPGRGNDTAGRGTGATAATTHARGLKTNVSRDAFLAHVTSSLQNANTSFGDDVSSLVDSIVNQLYSDS